MSGHASPPTVAAVPSSTPQPAPQPQGYLDEVMERNRARAKEELAVWPGVRLYSLTAYPHLNRIVDLKEVGKSHRQWGLVELHDNGQARPHHTKLQLIIQARDMKYIMHTPPISERDAKTWTRGPLKNEVKRGDLYYNVDGCGPSRTSWEQHVDGYLESRAERACMHFTVAGYPVYAAPSECLRYCALTSNWESMRVPE